ncbi:Elongation factor Tu GTP binding domain [seawater metagenome]|uniref:Elongation factor Tu GTP binding domain n=1 Tax=seawater metagenome TaxID=1561972 RepID=A0A5E8CM28_9ZZZZ
MENSNFKIKFVAIGHVDTGKSCLCGHLLYKCGFIDKHSMDKIRQRAIKDKMERWVWSRVLDIYEEEMVKGKTHEFNLIDFNYNQKDYQLIDTPGHQMFVRSMIEGISQDVNICVLLVSMIQNEFESSFEKGMLKEHLILARAMGIRHLLVIGNKMDAIDWDQEKYNKNMGLIKKFLKYIQWRENNVHFIPISAFEGIGLTDLENMPNWYKGKSFLDTLDDLPNKVKKKQIVKDKSPTKQIVAEIKLFNIKDIVVSNGFISNCHFEGEECELTFGKIKDKKTGKFKNIFKNGDVCYCSLTCNKNIDVYTDMKLIFRKDDNTIGFGKVIKYK